MAKTKYTYQGKQYYKIKVQIRDANGKMKCKSTIYSEAGSRISNDVKASQVEHALRAELEKELGQVSGHTFSSWHEEVLQRIRYQYKESTVTLYDGYLKKWLDPSWAERDLGDFTRQDIYEFLYQFLEFKGATDWTRKNLSKKVHRIFQMALEDGLIIRNPAVGIKVETPISKQAVLTTDEVGTLLTRARELAHSYYPHWTLALMTGMRNGELYALRWSDIDLDKRLIHVAQQFTNKDGIHPPKTGKIRWVDINLELKGFLLELKEREGRFSEKVWEWDNKVAGSKRELYWDNFVLPRIRSWRTGMQAYELRCFCKKIGITSVEFHDLRATYITNLLSNGQAISKVMKQVGHSKMQTTDRYHRLTGVEVKGTSDKCSFKVPAREELPDNVLSLFEQRQGASE